MTEMERLSGNQRKLLLDVSLAMGRTADEVLVEEYEETTPDHLPLGRDKKILAINRNNS